jgi:hypothetical protein
MAALDTLTSAELLELLTTARDNRARAYLLRKHYRRRRPLWQRLLASVGVEVVAC